MVLHGAYSFLKLFTCLPLASVVENFSDYRHLISSHRLIKESHYKNR